MTRAPTWNVIIGECASDLAEALRRPADDEELRDLLCDLLDAALRASDPPIQPRDVIRLVNDHTEEPLHVRDDLLLSASTLLARRGRALLKGGLLHRPNPQGAGPDAERPRGTQATLPFSSTSSATHTRTLLSEAAPRTAATAALLTSAAPSGGMESGSAPASLEPGAALQGKRAYRLEARVARGGMGEVWRAAPLDALGVTSRVAIKTVRSRSAVHATALERELDLLRTLSRSDFFPSIHESFAADGQLFIVMDWVEGENLHQAFSGVAVEQVNRAVFVSLMEQVADRLAYLHAWQPRPIVFRDLKPSNVMLDPATRHLRLVDFGISHLAADPTALRAGTRGYLAPEVDRGDATAMTDIFAMGRLALFLLFGHEEFARMEPRHVPPAHERRDLSQALVSAAFRLCDPNPTRRPASALAALELLLLAARRQARPAQQEIEAPRCPACQQDVVPGRQICSWCGGWITSPPQAVTARSPAIPFDAGHVIAAPANASNRPQRQFETLARLRSAADLGTLRCLPTLRVTPYPYQLDAAVQVLSAMNGRALIADDVGLGKTIEAGLVIKEYLLRHMIRSCLIVAPPGLLLHQIKQEMAEKFRLEFREYRSNGETLGEGFVGPRSLAKADLVIVSYDTLRTERNRAHFEARSWDLLVADECHKLHNRRTKRHRALRALVTRYVLPPAQIRSTWLRACGTGRGCVLRPGRP